MHDGEGRTGCGMMWPMPSETAAFTSPLAQALADDVLERFLCYARIDTRSARGGAGSPSTPGQLDLARLLVEELRAAGLCDVALDDGGYVMARLPGTVEGAPAIGLISHVDTSPDAPGAGVEPIVHRGWDGAPIALPRGGTVLDPAELPELAGRVGDDIVTASGDTLLGGDDKAGVAEIVAAVAYLAAHPGLPRPELRVGFTPDEEIGEGAGGFDIARFGADCAYTMDASALGDLQDETFSAREVVVAFSGVDVHPGFATGRLVNAARLAGRLLAELPRDRLTPETTSGREGFVHPYEVEGAVGAATVRFIARDFDDDLLAGHVALVRETAERIAAETPGARVEVADLVQYPNMRVHLEPFPQVTAAAAAAIEAEGIAVVRTPIRGGTDDSILSARGLPTPNLFTGAHEYHSVREWACVQEMAAAAAVIVRLAEVWTRPAYRDALAGAGAVS